MSSSSAEGAAALRADTVDRSEPDPAPISLKPWRRSLQLRLTVVQALAVAMTLLLLGTALYQVKASRLVRDDHEVLRRYAEAITRHLISDPRSAGHDPLRHPLDDLSFIHPELQVRIQSADGLRASDRGGSSGELSIGAPKGGASKRGEVRPGTDAVATPDATPAERLASTLARIATTPVRTEVEDGARFEVLDFRLGDLDGDTGGEASGEATDIRLQLPTASRQQILGRYLYIIVIGTIVGIVASIAVSVLVIRAWGRRLRRLSSEARLAAGGRRISATHVDTELVELVEAFNGALERLEQARIRSESFSADVAHELRSPLATLIGGAQLALSRPRRADELTEVLASNLEELERLKTLVNDMLFLARADQGERAQSLERADLGSLADATIDYCSALLDEAGLTAVRHGSAEAICNEALVRRAMANLLANAIQHCSGERRIELHLETRPAGVRLWAFNSGTPIPPEVVDRMFDRFYRANEARSDRGVRHGLGLSIVQAVARMHGGRVFAKPLRDGNAIGLEIPRGPVNEPTPTSTPIGPA